MDFWRGSDPTREQASANPSTGPLEETSLFQLCFNPRLCVLRCRPLWELSCAGFRHSAGFHARVVLDGGACRLGEPGEVHDVLVVLGDDRVPIALRVLVSW